MIFFKAMRGLYLSVRVKIFFECERASLSCKVPTSSILSIFKKAIMGKHNFEQNPSKLVEITSIFFYFAQQILFLKSLYLYLLNKS